MNAQERQRELDRLFGRLGERYQKLDPRYRRLWEIVVDRDLPLGLRDCALYDITSGGNIKDLPFICAFLKTASDAECHGLYGSIAFGFEEMGPDVIIQPDFLALLSCRNHAAAKCALEDLYMFYYQWGPDFFLPHVTLKLVLRVVSLLVCRYGDPEKHPHSRDIEIPLATMSEEEERRKREEEQKKRRWRLRFRPPHGMDLYDYVYVYQTWREDEEMWQGQLWYFQPSNHGSVFFWTLIVLDQWHTLGILAQMLRVKERGLAYWQQLVRRPGRVCRCVGVLALTYYGEQGVPALLEVYEHSSVAMRAVILAVCRCLGAVAKPLIERGLRETDEGLQKQARELQPVLASEGPLRLYPFFGEILPPPPHFYLYRFFSLSGEREKEN